MLSQLSQLFLNNFEGIVNRRVNIQEDIKCYQGTLTYASSKVDYSLGEYIYMLPSDLKLKIKTGTVRYNNKILVSNGNFILGKDEKVNSLETPAIKNHKTNSLETPTIKTHKTNPLETPTMKSTQTAVNSERTTDLEQKTHISHEDEKVAFSSFFNWNIYDMVHISMKVSHQSNKKGLLEDTFLYGAPAEVH